MASGSIKSQTNWDNILGGATHNVSSVTNKLMTTLLLWLLTTWERFLNQILQCMVDTFHETRSYVTERHGSEKSGALAH